MKTWASGISILQCVVCVFLLMTNLYASPSQASNEVVREFLPKITTISGPLERYGKIKVGYRATIVEYAEGKLAVFSPCPLTSNVLNVINGREVRFLIAPNLEHHIYIQTWKQHFRRALLIGPQDLYQKRILMNEKNKNILPLQWHALYSAANKGDLHIDEEFDNVFDCEFVDGHINKELVYLHKPSKTLIQADLIWNLPAKEQYSLEEEEYSSTARVLSSVANKLLNTKNKAVGHRAVSWYVFAKDRESFNLSIKRIQQWDFRNIIPCHGDVIISNGKEVFKKIMERHLQAKS